MNNNKPIAPISKMPNPDTFTIVLYSSESGFFVTLKTRLDSIMKEFNFCIIQLFKQKHQLFKDYY